MVLEVMAKAKRPIAALMAILLALWLIPVAAVPSVAAAASGASGELVLSFSYDGTTDVASDNQFTQRDPETALFNASEVAKPTAPSDGSMEWSDITDAVAQEIAAQGGVEGSAENIQVEWKAFTLLTPSVAAGSADFLSVDASGNTWVFTAKGAGNAQVEASVDEATVSVSFSYLESDEPDAATQNGSVDVSLTGLSGYTASYTVAIADLASENPVVSDNQVDLVYDGGSSTVSITNLT